MPLLYEVKYDSYVDETWLVYVDPVTQLTRLMKRNGYPESEALARIHAQLPIDDKRSLAQVIIDNTGSPEETQKQVLVAWQALMDRIKG
ncbi:dephospho-CoA kinase [Megasphaera sp. BL7]|nr:MULTISPECIES: dephospho-CoA kinase [unclassified Megasphaera]EPP15920.1 dephospho-CoA kinase [Megasphaera sp. BL7]